VDPGGTLRVKLTWLTVFRTVATSLLLAVLGVSVLSRPGGQLAPEDTLSFGALSATYLLTILYGLWLRADRGLRPLAWAQVGGDLLLATFVVAFTGGPESPFSVLYLLAVMAGALLLFERGAVVAAGSSALSVLAVAWVPHAWALPLFHRLAVQQLVPAVASQLVSQALVAGLATYLARQLAAAGGRLSRKEADLRQLGRLHRQILAGMPSGLVTTDGTGRVTFINRAGRALLGLPEEATGPQEVERLLPGVLARGPGRTELELGLPGGTRRLGVSLAQLEDAGDSAWLVLFEDLTGLRRAEEALRRADQLASLGRMAAQFAHEVRNPLASMRGAAQVLAQDLPGDPTAQRLLAVLVRESDRLAHLMDDFLVFARPAPPRREPLRLDVLARDTVALLRQDPLAGAVHLATELEPVTASADAAQLTQVLVNLLRNAFAAVEGSGRVKVSTRVEADGQVALRVWDEAGSLSAEDQGHVFEPFYSRRPGGTGLGLSICLGIVRGHGGVIDVSSSPADGTEFVVRLPAA
jgi:two-component system sensor histidine kinase PilS (NtrC family)